MRYAVVSDIHANLQAWNAVLLDIRSTDVDQIICLGDLIGYGPNPREVLESVYTSIDYFVLGNHDAAFCNKLDDALFNDDARRILDWSREQLGDAAVEFVNEVPLVLQGPGFRCAHGDHASPAYFNYITEPGEAMPSWQAVSDQLLFVGHTHQPAIFLLGASGTPHSVEPQEFEVEEEKRYLVNVGSVGQPRDGEARASYCVFDVDTQSLFWHRVPFDLDAYRSAVADAGIPEAASYFLNHDPRQAVPPLREMTSFSPGTTPDHAAQDVVESGSIEALRKRVSKWQCLFVAALTILLLGIIISTFSWLRDRGRRQELVHPTVRDPVKTESFAADANMLMLPDTEVAQGQAVPGWSITLENKHTQSVGVELTTDGLPCFVLTSSDDAHEIILSSHSILAGPGTKFCMEALFKTDAAFEGSTGLALELTQGDSAGQLRVDDQRVRKPPTMQRRDGWVAAKHTFTLPAGTISTRLQIRATSAGVVRVKNVTLVRK